MVYESIPSLITIIGLAVLNLFVVRHYHKIIQRKLREINDFITILDKALEDGNINEEEFNRLWAEFKDIVTSKQDKQ